MKEHYEIPLRDAGAQLRVGVLVKWGGGSLRSLPP